MNKNKNGDVREVRKAMVSGAGGFIASWVVKKLLERGAEVHGTVRDLKNHAKISHLLEMDKDLPGTLKLFEADLLKDGSFAEAAEGCDTIFHMASPFVTSTVKDPQRQLVDPAVKGTRNVLMTANSCKTVQRVVLTSSIASIMGDASDASKQGGGTFTEEDWNTTSSLNYQSYSYSKASAEREAWNIAGEQARWKLVVINPSFVLGPSLSSRSDATSTNIMLQFLNGAFKRGVPDLYFGIVDVRDVAEAHIRAAAFEKAEGRHIVSAQIMSMMEINNTIKKYFPDTFDLPSRTLPKLMLYMFGPSQGFSWRYIKNTVGRSYTLNNEKSRSTLKMDYRSTEETIRDQVQRLQEAGLV